MLVVNLKQFEDEEMVISCLDSSMESIKEDLEVAVEEEDKEDGKKSLEWLQRLKGAFSDGIMHQATEMVEKILGHYWDLFELYGEGMDDVATLMDDMGCTEEELLEIFKYLGYGND